MKLVSRSSFIPFARLMWCIEVRYNKHQTKSVLVASDQVCSRWFLWTWWNIEPKINVKTGYVEFVMTNTDFADF
jgi:hypothetical protein